MKNDRSGLSSLPFSVQLLLILGLVAITLTVLYALLLPSITKLLSPMAEMGAFFEEMREFDAQVKAATPTAGIHTGEALAWRSLEKPKDIISSNSVAGNFDHDGDEEVMVIGDSHSYLLELDGSIRQIGMASNKAFIHRALPYDLDGNGIDEIIPDATLSELGRKNRALLSANSSVNPSLHSVVFDIDGHQKGLLFGVHGFSSTCTADLNMDGVAEAVLLDNSASNARWKVLVYGIGGTKLLSATVRAPTESVHVGNVAGDAAPELVFGYYDSDVLAVIQGNGDFSEISLSTEFKRLGAVADMDADGVGEVFNGSVGYLNLVTGHYIKFLPPAGFPLESALLAQIFVLDTNGDGQMEVAMLAGPEFYVSGLYIFEPEGQCLYHEEFGKLADEVLHAKGSEKEHLVLIFEDEIKVWP